LFDLSSNDPNKIEIRDGNKSYFLTRSGQYWWSGSAKKMDPGAVQDLIDKIRDLSASKFVDTGLTFAPSIDLTVTSNDGKRVEKVGMAKLGDNYIAMRENDSTLYQIDAKAIDDLKKSAEDVKPATPPAK
jgi:hypothetical protein